MTRHVEDELIAYLDDELSAKQRARVEVHLATCSHCAAELERLEALQHDLGATLDATLGQTTLPREADARIRRKIQQRLDRQDQIHPWLMLWRQRGLALQALMAMIVLLFSINAAQVLRQLPAAPQETLVLGQDRLAPGSQAALRVLVRSVDRARPIEDAQVTVRVERAPGLASVVFTGQTDAAGTADVAFTVPKETEGAANLIVETASKAGRDRIVRPITIARDYRLFLSPDKPAYRPGQTIYMRAVALDALTLKPAANQPVTFTVLDAQTKELAQQTVMASEYGIAHVEVSLPEEATLGMYTLRATLGETVSERQVTVDRYELPPFRVKIVPDRDFYTPGDRVTGAVRAEYFFGQPVDGAEVTLRGAWEAGAETPAIVTHGTTDRSGQMAFAFDLPSVPEMTEQPLFLNLEARVTDEAGQQASLRQPLPIAAQPILIQAVPEGGTLKPNVENVIYLLTAYANGEPVETTVTVDLDNRRQTLTTGPYGLAELRYTPTAFPVRLAVRAADGEGAQGRATFTLSGDRQALLLRTERTIYEAGQTLRAEALVGSQAGQTAAVYLDIVHAGQTVAALSSPIEEDRAAFALDLDQAMVGELELHAYTVDAEGELARAVRLVAVDTPQQMAVTVTTDREAYAPGETARVAITTAITEPVQSAVGVGVVDESVYALDTLPPSFARAYLLLDDELARRTAQGLAPSELLEAEVAQETAIRAAWATAPGSAFTLSARSLTAEDSQTAQVARVRLASRIGLTVTLLPLLLSVSVILHLRLAHVLKRALRRIGLGLVVMAVASPLVALVVGGTMWLLWALLRTWAVAAVGGAGAAILIGLLIHAWGVRDTPLQVALGFLAAYVALGSLLILLAARGGEPSAGLRLAIVAAFLLTVIATATLGQGLVLAGQRRAGWLSTALALVLVVVALYLPFLPQAKSNLTRALGNPALYSGPVGWLSGCAAAPEETERTVEVTQVVEEEVEITAEPSIPPESVADPTAVPTEGPPAEAPTASAPPATAVPEPPLPLRQIFPETLYWAPEAVTDEAGRLTFDLPLADTVTGWRLTAMATTREGRIGTATANLIVKKPLFVELGLPPTASLSEVVTATVTVYNTSERTQAIQLTVPPAEWYQPVEELPPAITLAPGSVTALPFAFRVEEAGTFSLAVGAEGVDGSDTVSAKIVIE